MCGIAGIARLGPRPLPPPEVLERMRAALGHRGPDGAGAWRDDDVALAAVRLAIMDPAHGAQPVHGCDGAEVTLVHNGELYDHAAHAAALRAQGHAVRDRCDTTVLPHLYEAHGDDFLGHLRGMFALALRDGRRRRLLLARDRLGIKPLFLARTADFLLFASEIKALLASGLVPAELDRDALDDLFSLTYPCPPRTMFRGVEELRPGHLLCVEGRALTAPRAWWRPRTPPAGEHLRGSRRALEERTLAALRDAVRVHRRADVPMGLYLSGGLDSSALAALAAEEGEPLTALSIGFDDPAFDERAHIERVRRATGADGHVFRSSTSSAAAYPRALWHTELPLVVPVATSGLELSAGARSVGVRAVLTGDGADELFGGYAGFQTSRLRRLLRGPLLSWLEPAVLRRVLAAARAPRGTAEFLAESGRPGVDAVTARFGGVYPPWYEAWQLFDLERAALLGVGGRTPRPASEPPAGWRALLPDDLAALDPLDAQLAVEQATRLPAWILNISDRCSLAHGVEARVPFLDPPFVELVASLPPSLKLRGLTEKAGLRGALRGRLPESIRRRPKQPFVTPIRAWFFSAETPEPLRALMSPRELEARGLFDPPTVARLLARLEHAPAHDITTTRLEVTLMLVLGAQLLHRLFVTDFAPQGPPPLPAPDVYPRAAA